MRIRLKVRLAICLVIVAGVVHKLNTIQAESISLTKEAEMKQLVFLGDSLTAGFGVEYEFTYPALIQEMINARNWSFNVKNAGISGDTTAGGLSRLDWILKSKVDILVIALGANDGFRGLAVNQSRRNLEKIIKQARAKYPEIKILVIGMQIPPSMGPSYARSFKEMYPELVKDTEVAYMPFLLEGVAGESSLNQVDGIHPTAEGYAIVARNLWKYLEPILKQEQFR